MHGRFAWACLVFIAHAAMLLCERSNLKIDKDTAIYRLLDTYHTQTDLQRLLNQWAKNYTQIAQLASIGRTYTNADLFVMRLTSPMPTGEGEERDEWQLLKPKFKWVANMHGDETIGRELMVALIYYLLLNSKSDARIARLLSTTDIYIMPTMNPDGFAASAEGSCETFGLAGRGNLVMKDLNRDFPSQYQSLRKMPNGTVGDLFFERQPETIAVMKWILKENFVLSVNLHGGALVASYPYDETIHHTDTYGDSPDDSLFRFLAHTYANNHQTMAKGEDCASQFPEGITNGAKWYDLSGGMQDFNYLQSNAFEITLELSCCKYPSASEGHLGNEWDRNKEALLAYMEQIHLGIKGLIRDSQTQTAISGALIHIEGILHPVRSVKTGAYWRLLLPGVHNVTVTASGYLSQTKYSIVVTNNNVTSALRLDFDLQAGVDNTSSQLKDSPTSTSVHETLANYAEKLMTPARDQLLNTLLEPTGNIQYHNHQSLTDKLKDLNHNYPNITTVYSIGKSAQGRDLWVMVISDRPLVHEAGEPEVRYIGNIHGDESVGRECLVRFIEYLCINYGKSDYITKLVDNVRIHIMPSLNPDGFEYEYQQTKHAQGPGRLNINKIDLDRNFPLVELESTGNKDKSDVVRPTSDSIKTPDRLDKFVNDRYHLEPEVRAAIHWSMIYPFVLSGNLHGGALVANYPFNSRAKGSLTGESKSPDDTTFRMLAKAYSHAHTEMSKGTSCVIFRDGITNGAAWQVVEGGMQDWSYVYTSDMELSIELGCDKYPEGMNLEMYWNQTKGALLAFITQVVHGVRGFVLDQQTTTPLSGVVIHVHGIEHDVTTYQDGDFFRLLSPGVYNITVARVEYESETRENILVNNQSSTYVEFRLKRKGAFDQIKQEAPSKIGTIYNQTKEFVLHRTVFLVVVGVSVCLAVILSVIFAFTFLFLRYRHYSISRSFSGFKRYEPLSTDLDGSPLISRVSESQVIRNSHANQSDSEGDDDTIFASKPNQPFLS